MTDRTEFERSPRTGQPAVVTGKPVAGLES
jgi:hypothetical protein